MYTIDKETGCWNWALSKDKDGYGRVRRNGKAYGAHRYALMEYLGRELLDGCVCLHLCDNPSCVNPKHLKEGTQSENMKDCISKGRGGNRGNSTGRPSAIPWKEQKVAKVKELSLSMKPKEVSETLGVDVKWVRMIMQTK